MLDCRRAARLGESWESKPDTASESAQKEVGKGVMRVEKVEINTGPCPGCAARDLVIERLQAENSKLLAVNKPLTEANTEPANKANSVLTEANEPANKANSRKEYMRKYMAKRRARNV